MRASQPIPIQGTSLPKLLGYDMFGIQANIWLEQESFLAPCDAHMKRPVLQMPGRTVIGIDAPRGQEMRDHYMAPSSSSNPALNCMCESQISVIGWVSLCERVTAKAPISTSLHHLLEV